MKIQDKRLNIIIYFVIMSFSIIFIRLFYISIIRHNEYEKALNNTVYKEIFGQTAPRGKIYDRNNVLIVDNKAIKSIYYKRINGINTKYEIDLAINLSKILDIEYSSSVSMLKDMYIDMYDTTNLITDEEWTKLKAREITSNDINTLKRNRISSFELDKIDKKAAYIYYLMHNGYSYQEKLIKKNVTESEYALINANLYKYKGIIPKLTWDRVYLYDDVLRGILGNVTSEKTGITDEYKEYYLKKGYSINDRVGISGLEFTYDDYLKGEKAIYKNLGNGLELIKSEKKGNDLILSIDIKLQLEVENIVEKELINAKNEPNTTYLNKAFVIVSNPNTGEILSLVSKYINNGKVYDYTAYLPISSITVGSVIKGASISVGYKEGVIDIGTTIKDECVKLANTPTKCSWNPNGFGYINDIDALRLSSNVYQFKTAMKVGGYNYVYNGGLTIKNDTFIKYRNMFNSYGLGVKTEIDLPNESTGLKGTNDTPGLILDFSIGQYDTYTPLQLIQYINTIANNGERLKLYLVKNIINNNGNTIYENNKTILNKIDLEKKYIKRIQEGMREVLNYNGTGYGYINLEYNPAGKTGTSQSFYDSNNDGIIDKQTITSTFAGYAPYDNPKMSIVVITPDVSHIYGNDYLSGINKRISQKISKKYFEIIK